MVPRKGVFHTSFVNFVVLLVHDHLFLSVVKICIFIFRFKNRLFCYVSFHFFPPCLISLFLFVFPLFSLCFSIFHYALFSYVFLMFILLDFGIASRFCLFIYVSELLPVCACMIIYRDGFPYLHVISSFVICFVCCHLVCFILVFV